MLVIFGFFMSDADLVIVGGGLTGSSLAAALATRATAEGRSLRILVLEARAGRGPRFAGELIHPTGIDVLDASGLLDGLRAPARGHAGVAVRGFAVVPGGGAPTAMLSYAEIPGTRSYGFAMEHHDMVAELRRQASGRAGVEVRTGVRVTGVLRDKGRVVGVTVAKVGEGAGSSDEEYEIRAPLVLVAEGRHSRLRRAIGIEDHARLLSYTAAVLVDRSTLPESAYGHIFLGAPGPILAYPVADAGDGAAAIRMCIDVPTLPADKGTAAMAQHLRDAYALHLPEPLRGDFLRALDERPPEVAANQAIYVDRCVAPGAALVGDSGGCSHPITAAGMTICLVDIRILVEELAQTRLGAGPDGAALDASIDAALGRYQERRFRFVRAREILADALYEVFRGNDEGTRAILAGMLRYWQGGGRARAASLALLSGAESGLPAFLAEYMRVVGYSTTGALLGRVPGNASTFAGRRRSLSGLVGKSIEKMQLVSKRVRDRTVGWG